MHISPIISPGGEATYVAGLHALKQRVHRGWVVSLEWLEVPGVRGASSCMVIWPDTRLAITREAPGMWAIHRSEVANFAGFNANDRCTGGISAYGLEQCREALPMLGRDINDREALLSLADAVVTHLPDLVMMPKAPPDVRKQLRDRIAPMWDIRTVNTATGTTISEATI